MIPLFLNFSNLEGFLERGHVKFWWAAFGCAHPPFCLWITSVFTEVISHMSFLSVTDKFVLIILDFPVLYNYHSPLIWGRCISLEGIILFFLELFLMFFIVCSGSLYGFFCSILKIIIIYTKLYCEFRGRCTVCANQSHNFFEMWHLNKALWMRLTVVDWVWRSSLCFKVKLLMCLIMGNDEIPYEVRISGLSNCNAKVSFPIL